jgi:transcriptional regulator with XRE-family HTH domain
MNPGTKWIYDLYNSTGLSRKQFAEIAGLHFTSLDRWFQEEQDPYPNTLRKIGAAFGIEPPEEVMRSAAEIRHRNIHKIAVPKSQRISKPSPVSARWHYDGPSRPVCRKKWCEWKDTDGKCHMPSCMKEELHEQSAI